MLPFLFNLNLFNRTVTSFCSEKVIKVMIQHDLVIVTDWKILVSGYFIELCEWLLVTVPDLCFSRYIERFRHGRPQSREERQLMTSAIGEEELPFWWMSPSSLPSSSTPTKTTDKGRFSLAAVFWIYKLLIFSPALQFKYRKQCF